MRPNTVQRRYKQIEPETNREIVGYFFPRLISSRLLLMRVRVLDMMCPRVFRFYERQIDGLSPTSLASKTMLLRHGSDRRTIPTQLAALITCPDLTPLVITTLIL